MRFTLFHLFVGVSVLAVACAALTMRNFAWSSIIVCATVVLYVAAAISAIGLRGSSRAFAVGFLVFGCGYLLLGTLFPSLQQFFITNQVLGFLYKRMAGSTNTMANIIDWGTSPLDRDSTNWNDARSFFLIGKCLWSWLIAFACACFCSYAYTRREQSPQA